MAALFCFILKFWIQSKAEETRKQIFVQYGADAKN